MLRFPLSATAHPELEYLRQELRRSTFPSQLGTNAIPAGQMQSSSVEKRVTQEIQARRDRERRFGPNLFSDPVWDMLLALYDADLQARTMTASALCIASGTPANVALRWISVLAREQLLEEVDEPFDHRRNRIALSEKGIAAMRKHFESTES